MFNSVTIGKWALFVSFNNIFKLLFKIPTLAKWLYEQVYFVK